MLTTEQLYAVYKKYPQVFIDSRKVVKHGLFFALKGDNFDGNQFAQGALDAGAAVAIVDDPSVAEGKEQMILVKDSLLALQDLARYHRGQLDIPFVGITGSNGKTTTKELVSTVLSQKYLTFFTQGNLNNHIGVPLTILSIPTTAEMAVIEMGANHQGEIEFLCTLSMPLYGLITNIGKAHLEGFGGIEGVKKGKSELYRFLAQNQGLAFINKSEPFLASLASPVERKIWYEKVEQDAYFQKDGYGFRKEETKPFVTAVFKDSLGNDWTVRSQIPGEYNFNNIITAITVGLFFEVPPKRIVAAIEAYLPSNNRSQILKSGSNTIILDAYNANPSSMTQALSNIQKMEADYKVAILGDMLELGEYAEAEHRNILDLAQHMGLQRIILVGETFSKITEEGVFIFKNVDQLKAWWKGEKVENALILIKGSRGIKLEKLLTD